MKHTMHDKRKTKAQLINELEALRTEVRKLDTSRQELLEIKDYLENLIESSLDCVLVTDNNGRITKANRSFLKLFGHTRDEVLGESMATFMPAQEGAYESAIGEPVEIGKHYFDEVTTMVSRFLKDGKVSNWETYMLSKNNKLIPVDITVATLYKEGNIIGSIGILRDISERRKAKKEIRKGKDFLTNIIENSMDGIAIVDEKGL